MINTKSYALKVLIFRLDEEQHSSPPQGNPYIFFYLHDNDHIFHPLN
jgi:hypothetical protein